MKLIAALALTLAIASATSVPFQTCGSNNHATISSIDASPYPPVKGKALTVEAKGSLDEQLTSGKYTIEVQLFGITLLKKTGDICTLDPSKFSCPHDKGDITVSDTVTIPGIAPSGTYSIKLSSTDQNGDSLLCVQLSVKIGDGEFVVSDAAPAQSQDMIDMINRFPGNTWTAGYSERFQGMTMEHVKGLCGAFPESDDVRLPVREIEVAEAIPAEFDSRTQWGDKCPSTKEIRDQGSCGSCWAVSSAETMTDRLCIASNGADQTYLSAEDIMSCCGFSCGSGCDGGYPSGAFQYFEYSGVVSGGPYNSKQGCLPYEIASCEHHTTGSRPPCGSIEPTPSCTKQCQNGKQWSAAKHFGASSYSVPSDVASIQTEIMTNGPVTAAFSVYADFPSYKSGVYQHTSGGMLGGHAVKIIGWGTENGSPYWLVANSWNTDWGDLGGYFKILRGVDECGIESSIVAGMPKV